MPRFGWSALFVVIMLGAGCRTKSSPDAVDGEADAKVKSLGTLEVTARLVEIPDGAIFERDLYHYAGILKYEVVTVHRGTLEPAATIYVGHYDPWKPRSQAADRQVKEVGGTLAIRGRPAPPHGTRGTHGRILYGRDRGQVLRQARRRSVLGGVDKRGGLSERRLHVLMPGLSTPLASSIVSRP